MKRKKEKVFCYLIDAYTLIIYSIGWEDRRELIDFFLTESKVTKREYCCLIWFGSPKEYVLITNQRYFFFICIVFFSL